MSRSLLRDVVAKCSSWDTFRRALVKKSEKEKGDLFEQLVRAYLHLDPEYATKLRKVWLLDEVPSALRKKLKLPDDDQGIDLIAETNTGEYWAIQCKYRGDTARPLPWREISTFTGLAFGVCKNISFGLVCSTTERITRVLTHQDRIGFCSLDVWQGLDKEFFDRLRKLLGHKTTKLVPLKPRPHQKKAIADARKHFVGKKRKRGKLISPCGSGKSLTAYWIARDLKAKKIVVAVPSLALIRQTLKVWLRESMAHGDTVQWICVCSDESAGRVEQDDVAVLRQDLGVPCLTGPKEIASWLKQKKPGLTVVFTTYQSGEALGKAARRAKFSFDLGIMDEAHKTVGDGDKLFSHLVHDKNLTIKSRIFMTATERRYRGKSDKILSMDNAAIYGDTFHLLSFKQALENKPAILSDYRIVTILVSREEVAGLIRNNVFVKPDKGRWNKEIEAEMLASLVALRKAMRKYPIKHAVSFHSSIQRAEIFKDHNEVYNQFFKKHGTIETFHVSGKTPTGTRARIVNEFAATDRGLITNARCLTEGVDVPDIDCVMFADPRRSAVDIVQAVGRALRPANGKKLGYVIVPILHDAKAKPEDIFDSEKFQETLTTLRALAANDDRIIEYFRSVSQGNRRTGRAIVFELDEKLAKKIDLDHFTREIDLKCWSRLARLSWRDFESARDWVRQLKLSGQNQWQQYCTGKLPGKLKRPPDIPTNPSIAYKHQGWITWGDWFGTGITATYKIRYRSFCDARNYARSLGLRSQREWRQHQDGEVGGKAFPADIPRNPSPVYADKGWVSWGDWLGTGTIAPQLKRYRGFKEARAYVRSSKLKTTAEWMAFCRGKLPTKARLPDDIPTKPRQTYKGKSWVSMGDWLGTGNVASFLRKYRSFAKAKTFARGLKLNSETEWRAFCRKRIAHRAALPSDIPANPAQTYRDKGWGGWGDWLGSHRIASQRIKYREFSKARSFARSLRLKKGAEWRLFCAGGVKTKGRLPADIPANPAQTYAGKGWQGMGDWLGTQVVATHLRRYRHFLEARQFARGLKLKSTAQWKLFCKGRFPKLGKLPADIPAAANNVYKQNGWVSWGDWLGTGYVANQNRHHRPFVEARSFARTLGFKSKQQWLDYARGVGAARPRKPADIPIDPQQGYADKGWVSWGDWLGTGNIAPYQRIYWPFAQARSFVRSLKLASVSEWKEYIGGRRPLLRALPQDIPRSPSQVYGNLGWAGFSDWLGNGRSQRVEWKRKAKRRR